MDMVLDRPVKSVDSAQFDLRQDKNVLLLLQLHYYIKEINRFFTVHSRLLLQHENRLSMDKLEANEKLCRYVRYVVLSVTSISIRVDSFRRYGTALLRVAVDSRVSFVFQSVVTSRTTTTTCSRLPFIQLSTFVADTRSVSTSVSQGAAERRGFFSFRRVDASGRDKNGVITRLIAISEFIDACSGFFWKLTNSTGVKFVASALQYNYHSTVYFSKRVLCPRNGTESGRHAADRIQS